MEIDGSVVVLNFVLDGLADADLLHEPAERAEQVPDLDFVQIDGRRQVGLSRGWNGMARESGVVFALAMVEPFGGIAELLVFQEARHQVAAGIGPIAGRCVGAGGGFDAGKQHGGLDLHERCGHDQEIAGHVHIQAVLGKSAHGLDVGDVGVGDFGDGNIVNIQLVPLDEIEEQVERSVINWQVNAIIQSHPFVGGIDSRGWKMTIQWLMDPTIRQIAQQVIETEAAAVRAMVAALDEQFERAVQMILECPASLLVTGIGKAGHIARKLSATFSSTGTPSHFLSPADSVHGDLGSVRAGDVVLILSYSGESDEILRMLNIVKKLEHPIIAITASRSNGLGKFADVTLATGRVEEACPLGLAPSASTTAMLALGDALALTVMKLRKFSAEDFAMFHPAGQLGRKLIRVGEAMTFRAGENLAVASDDLTVGQVLHQVSQIKRRSGAVVLTNAAGKVSGIFTDGDLRRLIISDDDAGLRRPVREVMKQDPKRIDQDALASAAMALMRRYRIDELPVVDSEDRPVGLIDVQDLVVLKMLDVDDADLTG